MNEFGYETLAADGSIKLAQLRVLRQLRRVNLVERALADRYHWRVGRHQTTLPIIEAPYAPLLAGLRKEAVARSEVGALPFVSEEALTQLDRSVDGLRRFVPQRASSVHVSRDETLERPSVFEVGLDEQLLDFVENYLGVPVRYLGVDVKRELPDSKENGIRVWHRDIEDHRMLKFIIYLSDVDEDAGPFEWLALGDTAMAAAALGLVWGDVVTARELDAVVPAGRLRRALGARHSVHFFDPARVLHRAGPPTKKDRYSATFSYATRNPYVQYPHVTELNERFVTRWSSRLTTRQRSALVG